MKLTKRLIPAFAMLLVSAVLMSTASFAWFSMNTNVTATGMTVSAQSDSIFLEIWDKETSSWEVQGNNDFEATLLPVAHDDDITAATVETPEKWFFYYSSDPDKYEASGDKRAIPDGTWGQYVAHTTYKVRLNPNMVTDAVDVYVSSVTVPANTGITVIVKYGDNMKEFKTTNTDIKWTSNDDNIIDAMTGKDTEYTIDVYIYIDGTNTNVKTNNASALTGDVYFTLSASGGEREAQNP